MASKVSVRLLFAEEILHPHPDTRHANGMRISELFSEIFQPDLLLTDIVLQIIQVNPAILITLDQFKISFTNGTCWNSTP
jgi:hypothetical protein